MTTGSNSDANALKINVDKNAPQKTQPQPANSPPSSSPRRKVFFVFLNNSICTVVCIHVLVCILCMVSGSFVLFCFCFFCVSFCRVRCMYACALCWWTFSCIKTKHHLIEIQQPNPFVSEKPALP